MESFDNRVDFAFETASLLSGGIDSSVVAALAAQALRSRSGPDTRLKTFAFGVGESEDIIGARQVARHIGSEHHEKIVDLEAMLEVLPAVIYHLESFDPSLVRSAVSNYMVSRHAGRMGVEVLLSGEGGDEVFCGYTYLKSLPLEELHANQIACLKFLHNNAALRLDRMNQCNGVRVVTPLISGKLLGYALGLAPELKQRPRGDQVMEKWIFRKAFESDLPTEIVWRLKQEFSQGSGSAGVLPGYFEKTVADDEFDKARSEYPVVRSKEEYYYFRIFTEHFGSDHAVKTVGQWVSL
jgi:asparagine synthase (glutamine-hydrolysing)